MFGEKCNLASLMMLESWRKASAGLGLSDVNQVGASHFLGLEGPPCIAFGVVLSIDMFPCSPGEGCHLFSLGDCLGTGVGGAAVGGCSSTRGALAGGTDGGDGGDCPIKTW